MWKSHGKPQCLDIVHSKLIFFKIIFFTELSIQIHSFKARMLKIKCHELCEAGLRGLWGHWGQGLAEGLDVLHGTFRGASEGNVPSEAGLRGLRDLRGHWGQILAEGLDVLHRTSVWKLQIIFWVENCWFLDTLD